VKKGVNRPTPRRSKLDVFQPVIQELVVKKHLTATRVLRQIRALGYAGGYGVLKQYVRSIRRRSRRRPHLRFETDKGKHYGESGVMVRTWRRSAFGEGAATHLPPFGAT
jgi:transposase